MQKVAASVEMSGDIAMSAVGDRSNRSSRTGHRMMRENDRFSFGGGHDGMEASVAASTASSFYGGGVTITGGPPDEVFKDEYGNECTRYTNRTIIVNEHMANAAETRNHNGIDIDAPAFGASMRNRAIAFLFVATTIILLLVVFLDVGKGSPSYGVSKEDKLAAALGYNTVDDWDDDDDNFSSYTHSALGDD